MNRSFARAARPLAALVVQVMLAGCAAVPTGGDAPPEPGVLAATRNGPAGAPEGTCWGRTVSPAVVETVTRQVQVKPAQINPDGTIGAPPTYRTETRQEIVTPRVDNWFETPCPEAMTPDFIASLQRALQARSYYLGDVTGTLDPATRAAVEAFQTAEGGPRSGVLSLAAARALGLVAVPRDAG